MESKQALKRWMPILVALVVFVVINLFYFAPQFDGKVLAQHDILQYKGSVEDIMQHRAKYGEDPQWEGNMFSGMPAYLINVQYEGTIIKTLARVFYFLGQPASLIFIAMAMFFFMLLCMRFNPWIGIVPALAYGFSTYFFIIIGAGHITKMLALAFAPMLFGGVYYAFRRNMWIGAALTGVFATIEIGVNHPQITYYFLFILIAFWVNELVLSIRKRILPHFAKATGLLALAAVLAVGSNAGMLYYIDSHSSETMRGGSELTSADGKKQDGLGLQYATAWSYGKAETFNMLIPNLYGGTSQGGFSQDGEVAGVLRNYRADVSQVPAYWGPQPMTSGPVYLGAVALLLAVLGMFVLRGRSKWWVFVVTLLAVLLSWGSNFMGFTELFFNHFPMYNKFRTVSMILVIAEWSVPFLMAVVLQRLWCGELDRQRLMKGLRSAVLTVGGIALLFLVFGGALMSFSGQGEDQLPQEVASAMRSERASMMRADAVGGRRSLGVRGGKDQEDGFRAAARRVGDGRYGARQPALSERRHIRFAEPGRNPSDGGRPADPGRLDRRARIPGAESFGQHVQRRFDFLFPPFGRRLPRSQAAPLPGSDRPPSVEDEYERVQYAQYALRHRAGSTDGPVIRAA